ncbi:MAG: methylated-DNA--[protein]-cysteine S-methyltransferase [Chloroflexi bacterium]|nr:methylated-DNA--[protein]-cysteine S-methyltransferase [Chloroflexota bacterium]
MATLVPTSCGLVGVELGAHGVRQLRLPQATEQTAWEALGSPDATRRVQPQALGDLAARLQAYFRGEPAAFPDEVDLDKATAFQRAVYAAARQVPYGQRISYSDLAARAGYPQAARAVGQALARNPACLIIP